MKTATIAPPLVVEPRPIGAASLRKFLSARASAYVALTKPRITAMVLMTVAVGYWVGARGAWRLWPLLGTLLGTGLVSSGASVWNQYLERARDARMRRTARRPLPSGQVVPIEAAVFGTLLTAAGAAILFYRANTLAMAVALATFALYVFVYTPLKPRTTLNTAIGAVPGALPPVIGWAAAMDGLGIEPVALFLIVFLWQFPHFLAIAWIYRDDYARGGHWMLPAVDPLGVMTGRQAAWHALALVPAGLLPAVVGLAGPVYFAGALALGLFYLAAAVRFWFDVSEASARRLLKASILYLPAILALLLMA
ncbi:MAG: protoheme IX farnesyltransferase [Isosphaeraceae bacterium]|nr:protoheme IX farnesyltransferase [Isosphaeraceae bacterium]